jgi:uncharacterized paraquat-inducible protein A
MTLPLKQGTFCLRQGKIYEKKTTRAITPVLSCNPSSLVTILYASFLYTIARFAVAGLGEEVTLLEVCGTMTER